MSTTNGLKVFNSQITHPKTQEYLAQVLGEKKSSFVNNLTALVANNSKLQECEPMSLMYAGIKATALDLPLDPNLGFAYVIPYKNNKEQKTEAQFQIGYKGFVQLAIRSGQFKTINVIEVKEGELANEDLLTGEITFKRAENRDGLKTVGYAAYFMLTNGFTKMLYMDVSQMQNHAARYSQTYSSKKDYIRESSKWTTDFDAMAQKTVLKLLLAKYAPLSIEMQNAVKFDQAVIRSDNDADYIDNEEVIDVSHQEISPEELEANFKMCQINPDLAGEYFARGEITQEMFDSIQKQLKK